MNIINWIKSTIKEALEFEGAIMTLRTLTPLSNKEIWRIRKFATRTSKSLPAESRTDIIRHLYNFMVCPDLLEREIKRLQEEVNSHDKN